ncbi:MAG TPA: glycosyltransferase family 2 protein [Chitinophagaceae bacterium]|nr:glycosyltransferase family 2 protein [Chitinophagaceae bacterium]
MIVYKILFWTSLFIVWYSYIGYGMLLYFLVSIKKLLRKIPNSSSHTYEPNVSLVVAAYNEEEFIHTKIKNTQELDYPAGKLQVIFITDGSSDATPDIIKQSSFELLHQPQRKGKVAAMNRAIDFVNSEIVVFCDANTLLNRQCIRELVKHYTDERVGAVAGEKKVLAGADAKAAGAGEGIYWKYESFLKKLDSELYSVVGAAGELFSVRTHLFEKAQEDTIIEDFVQSLKVCMKGYVVRYEPRAYATETGSLSMRDEQKRKVRICAGAFQAMGMLKGLFNVFKYPVLSFQFLSHRILRWTLCPLSLLVLLLSNIPLAWSEGLLTGSGGGWFYSVFLALQSAFYLLAITGWLFANRNIKLKLLYVPYYFLFMNLSVFLGFFRFLQKRQTVLWEKAARQKTA